MNPPRITIAIAVFIGWCAILMAAPPLATAEDPIGQVRSVSGEAAIKHGKETRVARIGMDVFLDDFIVTGANGAMGVTFVDDTTLSLGGNSEITVDEYVFDPALTKASFLARVTQGTFVFASGRINKLVPDSMAVQTGVTTIGIRGTRFAVRVPPKGAAK